MARSVRSAIAYSVVSNYGALIINFGLTVAVSRLLTPPEVGTFVVALAFITIVDLLRDLGVASYVVQSPNLDEEVLGSVFGTSLLLSAVIGFLTLAGAPWIASIIGGWELTPLIAVMGASYFIAPLSVPAVAALQRNLQFKELLALRLWSAVVRAILSIALVLAGLGPLALAIGYFASKLTECVMVRLLRTPYRWVRPNLLGWRAIVRFGVLTSVSNLVSSVGALVADIATGKLLGMGAAGHYNRGAAILTLYRSGIMGAVAPVAYSAFAREARAEAGDVRRSYLFATAHLAGIGWPAFAVLGVLSEPMILTLFGAQWEASVSVAEILSIAGAIYLLASLGPKLLIAIGKVEIFARRELLIQVPRLCLVIAAAHMSIQAVAWATTASYALALVVNQTALKKTVGIGYGDLWIASRSSIPVAIVAGLSSWAASHLLAWLGSPLQLLAGLSAGGLAWIIGIFAVRHPLRDELRIAIAKFNVDQLLR